MATNTKKFIGPVKPPLQPRGPSVVDSTLKKLGQVQGAKGNKKTPIQQAQIAASSANPKIKAPVAPSGPTPGSPEANKDIPVGQAGSPWSTASTGSQTGSQPGGSSPATTTTPKTSSPSIDAQIQALLKQLGANVTPGADETGTISDINNLNKSFTDAKTALEGTPQLQGNYIGAGQRLSDQYTSESNTLLDKLGLLQAQRNSTVQNTGTDISALSGERSAQQGRTDAAQNFALSNKITQPFYKVAGTIYSTSNDQPFPDEASATAAGVAPDGSNVQEVTGAPLSAANFKTLTQRFTDSNGNIVSKQVLVDPVSGAIVDPGTGQQLDPTTGQPISPGNPTTVGGANFLTYASDPNYTNAVSTIFNSAPVKSLTGPGDIDSYIKSVAPNSPLTGQIIENAASAYGVDPRLLVSMAQQESKFGTAGAAVATNNPWNVGNTGSATQTFPDLQSAANAAALNVSNRMGSIATVAQAIESGSQPPPNPNSAAARTGKGLALMSQLAKDGFNVSTAYEDWTATQKYLASLNSTQQLRLRQAVSFVPDLLDSVSKLSAQWNGGNFAPLNSTNLKLAMNGVYGQQAQSIATQLNGQISDVVSDLGTVYKGGNSSTDESLSLAAKQLSTDWSDQTLQDNINLIRNNIKIRQNSINVGAGGVSANSPYTPPGQTPAATGDSSATVSANPMPGDVITVNGSDYLVNGDGSLTAQ